MARLSDEEIEERRSELGGWERDGGAIRRTFELSSWPAGSTDWPEPMLLSASSADERRRRSSK
jgi:hypothetical protein